jgi:hypothetical protein
MNKFQIQTNFEFDQISNMNKFQIWTKFQNMIFFEF